MKAATNDEIISLIKQIISIHAAREGGDAITAFMLFSVCVFQSTPPVKAATSYSIETPIDGAISIHAAREGGDGFCNRAFWRARISIHAAREGGDR